MSHDASSADGARGDEDRDAGSPAGETRLPEQAATPGRTRMPALVVTAALILVADLLTKIVVVATIEPGNPVYLIGDWLRLTLVRNPGAAFSMATGMTWLLTLVAVGVVVAVVRMGRRLRSGWWALGLGLVLGGALGNLVDRFFRAPGVMQGHVVDFVAVGWWPVFNVADSAIVCGAVLLVALTLFGVEPNAAHRKADA